MMFRQFRQILVQEPPLIYIGSPPWPFIHSQTGMVRTTAVQGVAVRCASHNVVGH